MKQYIYNFGNRIVGSFGVILFSIILGNVLSQNDVGIYSLVVLASAYAIALFTLKINPSIIQKLNDTKNVGLLHQYFTAGLLMTIGFGALIVVIYYLSLEWIQEFLNFENSGFIYFASYLAFILIIRGYADHILMSLQQNKYMFFTSLVSLVVNIGVFFILSYIYKFDLYYALYALIMSNIVYILIAVYKITKYYNIVIDKQLIPCMKSLFSFSFIVYFVTLAAFMDSNVDLLIINHYFEKEQVAIYNYAIKIAMLFLLVGASISNVNYPKMTKLYSQDKLKELSKLLYVTLNINFFLIFTGSIIFLSLSNEIINFILPSEYNSIVGILFILVPGIVLYSGFLAIKSLFNAMNMPSVGLIVAWGAFFLNLVFSLLLVPKYGLYGGAIGTTISYFFSPFAILVLIRIKTELVFSIKFIYMAFPLYLIAAYSIYYFQYDLIIKTTISFLFVGILLILFKPYHYLKEYR